MRRAASLLILLGLVLPGVALAKTVTIANGASKSDVIDMRHDCAVGIRFPTMTGSNLTAECCTDQDGGTCSALYESDGSTQWSRTITADRFLDLTIGGKAICGCSYLKLVSDGTEGAERTLHLELGR